MKQWLMAIILGMGAVAAQAQCPASSKTVFACQTTKGKQVEVCDAGKTIGYSFGKPGAAPELALHVPRAQASTSQWQGVGRYMSYAVDIPNGKTVYSVFWGVDRLSEEHVVEAGVNVLINGKQAAAVLCRPDTVQQALEGIDLKPTE